MKEKDEELDNVFRKGLEDPVNDAAYREADWDAMEQMLDKHKKRPAVIYWLPLIGSAAALILIFLGWLFFKSPVVKPEQNGQLVSAQHPAAGGTGSTQSPKDEVKAVTGISGGPTRQSADNDRQKEQTPVNYARSPDVAGRGRKSKSFLSLSPGEGRRDTVTNHQNDMVNKQPVETLAETQQKKTNNKDTIAGQNMVINNTLTNSNKVLPADTPANKQATKSTSPNTEKLAKIVTKPRSTFRPQFALGVMASSDLNGVNSSFQQSKVGGNFGLQFSAALSKKWTVSTGASYDIKPYLTGIGNYHTSYQFATEPVSISANCRMIEIPLNVNYQVYGKRNNKISLGTGLSSYIILREDYNFNYAGQYNQGPAGFSVINKNRNIFSILNLDATYQHQINSKVGLLIQPYLKVPLSNVGESQVRLQTSGVAVGLSWNLNSLTKK